VQEWQYRLAEAERAITGRPSSLPSVSLPSITITSRSIYMSEQGGDVYIALLSFSFPTMRAFVHSFSLHRLLATHLTHPSHPMPACR